MLLQTGTSPVPTKNQYANAKVFARLFQKAAQSKGSAFGRPAHRAKFFFTRKRRRGGETVRRTVSPWGTLAGGSPVPPGTPNSSRKFARVLLISPGIGSVGTVLGVRRRTANRGFYFVLKTALSSRHRLCAIRRDSPWRAPARNPPSRNFAERGPFLLYS